MPFNQNHTFEELNGIKCGIVEKNVNHERAQFLKKLLEYNNFTVVVVPTPPPKIAPAATAAPTTSNVESSQPAQSVPQPQSQTSQPETFTIGVTDTTFNSINAIFGRLLRTPDGHVVTLAYWQQKDKTSHDEIPYFEQNI